MGEHGLETIVRLKDRPKREIKNERRTEIKCSYNRRPLVIEDSGGLVPIESRVSSETR